MNEDELGSMKDICAMKICTFFLFQKFQKGYRVRVRFIQCCYQDHSFQDQDQKVQDQDLVSSNKVNATTEDRPTITIIPNLYPVT